MVGMQPEPWHITKMKSITYKYDFIFGNTIGNREWVFGTFIYRILPLTLVYGVWLVYMPLVVCKYFFLFLSFFLSIKLFILKRVIWHKEYTENIHRKRLKGFQHQWWSIMPTGMLIQRESLQGSNRIA